MREMGKPKTAEKTIVYNGNKLKNMVLDVMTKASTLVGSTLGPNGKVVLIERNEQLPPLATKDGITVFNSISFSNSTSQSILEAARNSASKTNIEANDGTTTSTILAEALIRNGFEYLSKNPQLSVQKVMRELENAYENIIVGFIKNSALKINNDNSQDLLKKVALIATNNDQEMSTAVIDCFDLVGHGGNITIIEASGSSGFGVEKIEGFHIPRGFEDTCGKFLEEFINDKGNYRTVLEKPRFILYNGKLNDVGTLLPIINKLDSAGYEAMQNKQSFSSNVVVVAHHFSDIVLATLASNFKSLDTHLRILPLKTPLNAQSNSLHHFLLDMQAFTGAEVFDPLTKPLETAEISDLGLKTMHAFEYNRFKSMVLGDPDEIRVFSRVDELQKQLEQPESARDAEILQERIAILTGGIARLKVYGSSDMELKEKRHRVDDAVGSVKGALKYGVLPGCSKTLLTLIEVIKESNCSDAVKYILTKSFSEPFKRIMENGGHNKEEIDEVFDNIMYKEVTLVNPSFMQKASKWFTKKEVKMKILADFWTTYDAMAFKYGNAIEIGVIDSVSAVQMAIKNSIGVAKMLMGLSGIVTFKRDADLDRSETLEYIYEQNTIKEFEVRNKWSEDND